MTASMSPLMAFVCGVCVCVLAKRIMAIFGKESGLNHCQGIDAKDIRNLKELGHRNSSSYGNMTPTCSKSKKGMTGAP